jgi:Protein of unknown function (DUF2666).
VIFVDDPTEYIEFMAKYKDWISIRKLGIREHTKPEEVVFHMAGIRTTIDGKMFKFLGINTEMLDRFAETATANAKKNYQSLGQIISSMSGKDAKAAIEQACTNKVVAPLAENYLLNKLITNMKFDTGISQLEMSKIFPELKPPRAPGRMGKGKKTQ